MLSIFTISTFIQVTFNFYLKLNRYGSCHTGVYIFLHNLFSVLLFILLLLSSSIPQCILLFQPYNVSTVLESEDILNPIIPFSKEVIQVTIKQWKDAQHHWLFSSVQFSRSVVSDSLRPHESQHTRPPCPSPTPGADSNSCPSSQWCHPAISSSVVSFSSCPQSPLASGSFPMSHLFPWGERSTEVSASASVTDY